MADDTIDRELNRLYWESDASISEIANRLDVSRRALYDAIQPRPAGRSCPECGATLGFRNRTSLENLEAECPNCGLQVPLGPTRTARPAGGAGEAGTASEANAPNLEHTLRLSTAVLAGMTLGALAAHAIRRR